MNKREVKMISMLTKYIQDMESYLIDDLADGHNTVADFDFLKLFAEDTKNDKLGSEVATVRTHFLNTGDGEETADVARKTFHISEKELEKLP